MFASFCQKWRFKKFNFLKKPESHLSASSLGVTICFFEKEIEGVARARPQVFLFSTGPQTHHFNHNHQGCSNSICFQSTATSFGELYLIGVFICLVFFYLVQLVLVANTILAFSLLWREKHRRAKYVR